MNSDFETFMGVVKGVRSSPDSWMKERIGRAIYFSDGLVRDVFFPQRKLQTFSTFGKAVLTGLLAELAVTYCSFSLAHTTFRGFSKTVHNVSFSTIYNWFQTHGIEVGRHFIVDFMNDGDGMSAIETHKSAFLSELMAKCCNDVFIEGFMLECVTGGSTLPVIAFLNYVDYLDPSLRSSKQLLNVWIENRAFADTIDYQGHNWLETTAILFNEHTEFFDSVKSDTLNACSVTTFTSKWSWGVLQQATIYGEKVEDWTRSAAGPQKYNLWSGLSPNNQDSSTSPPPHGH